MKNSLFDPRAWAAVFLGLGLAMILSACGKTAVAPETDVAPPPAAIDNGFENGSVEAPEPAAVYSLDELALHRQVGDCWLAIDGQVYDASSFTPDHPGGEAILQGCGRDASAIFNARHDDRAKALLPDFYIGDLAK